MLGATQQRWRSVSTALKHAAFANPEGLIERLDPAAFSAQPRSDRIHQFLAYWQSLRGSDVLPNRADLDPLAMPSVLTGIWLITIEDSGAFKTRLAGESINRFFGRSLAGHTIADILPEPTMTPLKSYLNRIRETGCLLLEQGDLLRPDGTFVYGERLFAPFASQKQDAEPVVDHIVGVTIASGPVSETKLQVAPPSQVFEASPF